MCGTTVAQRLLKLFFSELYVTKVLNKFEQDGGYIDHRQFNRRQYVKEKVEIEKVVKRNIKKKPNISSV